MQYVLLKTFPVVKKILAVLAGLAVLLLAAFFGLLIYVEYNQATLLERVKQTLSKNIRGHLHIEKLSLTFVKEFPNLSLTIENVSIKDSAFHKEVFEAEKVFFRVNTLPLLRLKMDARSILIENGKFYLYRDTAGYFNAEIFRIDKTDTTGSGDINFELEKLRIQNLQIVSVNDLMGQHISVVAKDIRGTVTNEGDKLVIPLEGTAHIDSMIFKADKGAFFVNRDATIKTTLEYVQEEKKLNILESPIVMDGQTYKMKGYFSFAKKPAYINLDITNPNTDFSKARLVLSDVIAKQMVGMEVSQPVDVHITVKGDIIPLFPPEVDVNFKVKDANIKAYGIDLTNVTLDGLFMNHVRPGVVNEDSNSRVAFVVKHARVQGVPISANVSVTDLKKLHLDAAIQSHATLRDFNKLIPDYKYRFTGGNVDVDVAYKGTLDYYLDSTKRNEFDDTLRGSIKVANGAFVYDKRKIVLEKINTDIDLSISKIDIKNLSASLNGNDIFFKGGITSLRKIFVVTEQRMQGNFTLDAPNFDLGKVLTKDIMAEAAAKQPKPEDATKAAQAIDELTDRVTASILFTSNRFNYKKLVAQKVKGEFIVSSKGILVNNFHMNTCKGTINIKGGLNTIAATDRLNADVQVKNVDINEFLKSTDNFNQSAIVDTNVRGLFTINGTINSPLGKDYVPVLDSIKGRIYFSLKQGALINFKPLQDIGKTIFKKRDFNNVTFAEIHDTVLIRDGKLFIKRMEISSSVLRLFIQGRYAFKGVMDIAIQFPLNNIGKKSEDYYADNIGTDAKVGGNIMLRVHGENNKTKITVDAAAMKRMDKELEEALK